MGRLSRVKGAVFERAVAKTLGEWWGCEFVRTTLYRGSTKRGLRGDIVPVNPAIPFPFSVECKDVTDWSIDAHVHSPGHSALASFIRQAVNDSGCATDDPRALCPMVIAKQMRRPALCFIPVALTLPAPRSGGFSVAGVASQYGEMVFDSMWFSIYALDALVSLLTPEELVRQIKAPPFHIRGTCPPEKGV